MVVSVSNIGHDGHIIVYMSDHDCLIKKQGIKDLGENNGVVHQIHVDIPISGVNTGKKIFITYQTARSRTRPPTLATAPPTPNISACSTTQTTTVTWELAKICHLHVNFPTRENRILDLILADAPCISDVASHAPLSTSDHNIISFTVSSLWLKSESILYRDFKGRRTRRKNKA
ncbi:hypothetical protein OSTOST_20989 [Ostertagia ostertagi]